MSDSQKIFSIVLLKIVLFVWFAITAFHPDSPIAKMLPEPPGITLPFIPAFVPAAYRDLSHHVSDRSSADVHGSQEVKKSGEETSGNETATGKKSGKKAPKNVNTTPEDTVQIMNGKNDHRSQPIAQITNQTLGTTSPGSLTAPPDAKPSNQFVIDVRASKEDGAPLIDVNKADGQTLMALPLLSEKQVTAILAFRDKFLENSSGNAFPEINDLALVDDIPAWMVEELDPFLIVENEGDPAGRYQISKRVLKAPIALEPENQEKRWVLTQQGATWISVHFAVFNAGYGNPVAIHGHPDDGEPLEARYAGSLGPFSTRPIEGDQVVIHWEPDDKGKQTVVIDQIIGYFESQP